MEKAAVLSRRKAEFLLEVAGKMTGVRYPDVDADLVDVVVRYFDEMYCFFQTLFF